MKPSIYFLILILLLPITIAETQLFSGKVITGTDKVIEGGIFRFTYDETSKKAFVQTPSTGLIVDNGACKSNAIFKVCINKANFSYRNSTTWVSYYDVDTTIYKLTGSLDTTSKATLAEMLQNEQAEFYITITNPTNFEITSINYKEDLAPFTIIETTGCSLDGSTLSWQGSLKSKWDKTCTAKIVANKEDTYTLKGDLTYFNGYETEKKTTDSVSIKVLPKQLKHSQLIDKNIEAKQPFHINVSLQNIHTTKRIEGTVIIELPSNIMLLENVPGFIKDFNTLKRSLILEPSSHLNYSLYLEVFPEGDKPIKQKFEYTIDNIRNVIENYTFVNAPEPKPIVNFSAESAELKPGQKFVVVAKVKNPSKVHKLNDIKAKLNAPFNKEITQTLAKLMPNETYAIISQTLIAPSEAGDFEVRICIEYKFNEVVKSVNLTLPLIVVKEVSIPVVQEIKTVPETKPEETAATQNKTENGTAEQVVIEDVKPKSSYKQILLFITIIFLTFFTIFFIINRIRKRKKESAIEQLKKELKSQPKEHKKQKLFKPNT